MEDKRGPSLLPINEIILKQSALMAEGLERENEQLKKANLQLKTQYRSQEDDREFLVRQLVSVKKENVRLRQEVDNLNQSHLEADSAPASRAVSRGRWRRAQASGGPGPHLHAQGGERGTPAAAEHGGRQR